MQRYYWSIAFFSESDHSNTVHVQYYVLQSGQDGTNQGQFEILADLMLHLQSTKISVFWKNYEKNEWHWNMHDHKVHF